MVMRSILARADEEATVVDLNDAFDRGDVAFIALCSGLVFLMVPGIALLYSGLLRRKSALQQLFVGMIVNSIVTFQWYFWGYSLAYSTTASNNFIGNLHNFAMRHVAGEASQGSPLISTLLYSFFQLQFAAVTTVLVTGAVAERGSTMAVLLFASIWVIVVYCPIAYWVWNANGWAFKWGVLDYAGGGPVEIASGVSAFAYSQMLGKRTQHGMAGYRPHNLSMVMTGTFLLMFGWLGFNGGSAFGANERAVYSMWNTFLCAAMASITWVLLDWRLSNKLSLIGWCSGCISGLVAATPASGFIPLWGSIVLGIVTGAVCNFATALKFWANVDDALDVLAEHAIGGILGLLANAFFAKGSIIALDGVNTEMTGGFLDHSWSLIYKQIAYIVACAAWSYGMTLVIAFLVDCVINIRISEAAEIIGTDEALHNEYVCDYVEARRDWVAHGYDTRGPLLGVEDHQEIVDSLRPPVTDLARFDGPPTIREYILGPMDPAVRANERYAKHLSRQQKAQGSHMDGATTAQRVKNFLLPNSQGARGEMTVTGSFDSTAASETSQTEARNTEKHAGKDHDVNPTEISAATDERPPVHLRQD